MFAKKKIVIIVSVLVLGVLVYVFTPKVDSYFMLKRAVKAAGGFPYQVGLTSVTITQCQTSCCSIFGCRCCTGGTLCSTLLTEAQCLAHSDVMGTPAGGMGSNGLFLNTAITQAGLSSGGQLIAGGMSSVLMDSGVLASSVGCSGCMAKAGLIDRAKDWFASKLADFIIAGKRDN